MLFRYMKMENVLDEAIYENNDDDNEIDFDKLINDEIEKYEESIDILWEKVIMRYINMGILNLGENDKNKFREYMIKEKLYKNLYKNLYNIK